MLLYFRLMLGSIAILLAVLALLFLMNYMKFQTILSEVVSSRLQVTVSSIGRSLSNADALGLKLTEMNDVPILLARAKLLDSDIVQISVVNTGGVVLHSTQPTLVGSNIDNYGWSPASDKTQEAWYRESADFLTSGLTLRNAFDRPVGSVVLVYSKAGYNAVIEDVARVLLFGSIVVFALFSSVMMLAARFACRELSCVYGLVGQQMSAVQRNGVAMGSSQTGLPPDTRTWIEGIGKEIHRIERIRQSADEEIEKMRSQIQAEIPLRDGCRQ